MTRACQGVPSETIETAKHYIEKTEATKGLNVVVRMLDKVYKTGRKYAKDFFTYVVDKHPNHELAAKSRERLEALDRS